MFDVYETYLRVREDVFEELSKDIIDKVFDEQIRSESLESAHKEILEVEEKVLELSPCDIKSRFENELHVIARYGIYKEMKDAEEGENHFTAYFSSLKVLSTARSMKHVINNFVRS